MLIGVYDYMSDSNIPIKWHLLMHKFKWLAKQSRYYIYQMVGNAIRSILS